VREELGLAYSIYSSPSAFTRQGSFNIVFNISAENTEKTLSAVKTEIKKLLGGGISQSELERAKIQLKSACIFSQENVQTIMNSNGKLLLMCGEVYDIDKKIREIDAVTTTALSELSREILSQKAVASAYVGKAHNVDFAKMLSDL
jgi:predicted Zn-dependent peptidase